MDPVPSLHHPSLAWVSLWTQFQHSKELPRQQKARAGTAWPWRARARGSVLPWWVPLPRDLLLLHPCLALSDRVPLPGHGGDSERVVATVLVAGGS